MKNLLQNKKLVMFCGKGGVGKTAVSLAASINASELGRKTLLLSMTSIEYVEDVFKKKIGENPTKLMPNFYASELNPRKAAKDLINKNLKGGKFIKKLIDNKVFQSIIEATAGFKEMLTLTNLTSYCNEYDLVVMDAPATGHSITLLNSPQKIKNLVSKGILYEEANNLDTLFKDETKTSTNIVTILEEMAVNEAVQLSNELKKLGMPQNYIIVNQKESARVENKDLFEKILNDESLNCGEFSNIINCNKSLMYREKEKNKYSANLTNRISDVKFIEIPIVYSEKKIGLIKKISEYLEKG